MKLARVAYVVNVFPKLSETFIANEMAHLRSRGVELRILSLREPGEPLQHRFVRETGLLALTTYGHHAFANVLRDFRPHVLHAHFATEPAEAAWRFSEELGVPFTFTAHGYDIHRKPPADFSARAAAASAVVTVSRANAEFIQKRYGVPEKHLRVIPCGVNTELFKPADRDERVDPPLIVCVARHVMVKNLSLLLRACAILRARGIPFRCVLLGEGPCRKDLEKLRIELALRDSVLMPGAAEQKEVLSWWRQAAIGVLTSDNEGVPVSLMEASACGLPVVATAVGGIPELVQNGVTGFLAPPGDPEALANALEQLLSNPSLRATMGAAARARMEALFSVQQQVGSLIELWTQVLTRHGHG